MQDHPIASHGASAPLPFIAADVGGTHARIGLLRATRTAGLPVEVLHVERYACAQWPSLADILVDFVARFGPGQGSHGGRISHAVLACAGYVQDGAVINVNLPWPVSMDETRQRAGLQQVAFINDFEALAHAVAALDPAAMRAVVAGADGADCPGGLAAGPILVMGPGTGLGCAAVLPGTAADPQPRIVPSEASHTLLAPNTARERAVVEVLAQRFGHVEVERAVSGPGLLNLYQAICQLDGSAATLNTPAEVTRAAVAGESATATEALAMFCALLGCFAANMAIAFRARGGVVLAGGILPQMEDFLMRSDFRQRFLRPGLMLPFLQQVPVRLVDHGELGIVGAGCWSLNAPL